MPNLGFEDGDFGGDAPDASAYILQSGAAVSLEVRLSLLDLQESFSERLIASSGQVLAVSDATPRTLPPAPSIDSMAVLPEIVHSLSIVDSHSPPTLTSSAPTKTTSSEFSRGGEVQVRGGFLGEDGIPLYPKLSCEFWWLDCKEDFERDDLVVWHEHCKSHLGPFEPPKEVSCSVVDCCWTGKAPSGHIAWDARQKHIQLVHMLDGMPMPPWKVKLAPSLLKHLLNNDRITQVQFRELRLRGAADPGPQAFIQVHRSERNERRRRGPRG